MSDFESIGEIIERCRPTWEKARESRSPWEFRQIHYRTVLLPFEQAERFARVLQANADDFEQVGLFFDERARDGRDFYVQFTGIGPGRKRMEAAASYVYALDLYGPRPFYWCLSVSGEPYAVNWRLCVSGETYQVSNSECTCAEWQRAARRRGNGIRCEHQGEMVRRVYAGELPSLRNIHPTRDWQKQHALRAERCATIERTETL